VVLEKVDVFNIVVPKCRWFQQSQIGLWWSKILVLVLCMALVFDSAKEKPGPSCSLFPRRDLMKIIV
jgi:hypothetical protein